MKGKKTRNIWIETEERKVRVVIRVVRCQTGHWFFRSGPTELGSAFLGTRQIMHAGAKNTRINLGHIDNARMLWLYAIKGKGLSFENYIT